MSATHTLGLSSFRRTAAAVMVTALVAVAAVTVATPAPAQEAPLEAPWNGQPISPGLGPTYGDPWCQDAAPGSSIANQQSAPLALIPQEAVGCTLAEFEDEAAANGVPDRMSYSVIGQSAGGRDVYGVVVNALETQQQQRDFERWQQIRAIELTDPVAAQQLLDSFGTGVKMPVFVQANIHGNEEEGADAIMQVIRDLVTLPRGTSEIVDAILDQVILIVIPMENPDGRFQGIRANGNGFDMNRDFLVQSQSEVRASTALQQKWLATVGLDLHGYVNPTLIDGLTKPHNPGIEYDTFLNWNQQRLDANELALAGVGMPVTRPVNDWNQTGIPPGPGHPYIAEGWDDWGPFYTQTYMAFYGVDSSTVEMCSSQAGGGVCNGRLGGKVSQYVTFYSSVDFWLDNKVGLMSAQLENFRRGVEDDPRQPCCADPLLTLRGFTEDQHNWMTEYPTAYVIPQNGGGQRSNAEANRMVRWLLDNGIEVSRTTETLTWNGRTFPARSYVVWMNQAFRGLALTTLSAGQDISNRIMQLYSAPGAWSHGLLWGADVIEIPRGDASFDPPTVPIAAPNALKGGINGLSKPSDFYSVTLRGVSDHRAILDLLRSGVDAEIAEEPFTSTTGGPTPAGSLIFPNDPATVTAINQAGQRAGLTFQRNVRVPKPATTQLDEAPKVAILVGSDPASRSDTSESLRAIFGEDAGFVSIASLGNAPEDPLLGFDVIYNTGQPWPSNQQAQDRLRAFFERGGGYIATSVSTANYSFLTAGGLVQGSFTQGSQTAAGGIAIWKNAAGGASPLTGIYPAQDFLYLPQNITYFTATPTGSTVAGRYHENMAGTPPNGPSPGFVAGLWRNRQPAANNAPVIVHGSTTLDSRYLGFATNPFSRQDAEREWALIAQTVLWSNLTDDGQVSAAVTAASEELEPSYSAVRFTVDLPIPIGEKP